MPRADVAFFLDLETTGNNIDLDEIIEVGCVLISLPDCREVDARSVIVKPSDAAYERMVSNSIVRKMHSSNGLLTDVGSGTAITVQSADYDISTWLLAINGGDPMHTPLGGSGVLHFDRKFVMKYMPRLNALLSFWAYDVGVLRRTSEIAKAGTYPISGKTHRALDDARVHVEEFKYYIERLKFAEKYFGLVE